MWLAERGWSVTAVDFAEAGLVKGRRLEQSRVIAHPVDWVHADVTTYDPRPGQYDVVLLAYLQLPPAQRALTLQHASVALGPGGALLVIGHDSTNLARGYGGPQDPSVLFTPDDVLADLAGAPDLRVELAERHLRRVQTPQGERVAIDATVRMTRRSIPGGASRNPV